MESSNIDSYDLESFRERAETLYTKEKRPLKDVMRILNKEGCKCSRNMYLKKFQSWGLTKYNRHEEMLQLRQMIKESHSDTKKEFRIQGRTITAAQVLKYFERRKGQDSKGRISTYTTVISLPLNKTIKLEVLEVPEQLFHAAFNAQAGLASSHRIRKGPINTSPVFFDNVISGTEFMSIGRIALGGTLIERGLCSAKVFIQRRDPEFIKEFLILIAYMINFKQPNITEMVTRYVYQLSTTVHGNDHFLSILAKCIYQQRDNLSTMATALKAIYDATLQELGVSFVSISAYIGLITVLRITDISVEDMYAYYERGLVQSLQVPDVTFKVVAQREYAGFLALNGSYSRAMELYREILAILFEGDVSTLPEAKIQVIVRSCGASTETFLSEVKDKEESVQRERYHEVETMLKMIVEKSILYLGPSHTETLVATDQLAEFYTNYGSPEKASIQVSYINDQIKEDLEVKRDPSLSIMKGSDIKEM